jgi:leucine dehydrogenase
MAAAPGAGPATRHTGDDLFARAETLGLGEVHLKVRPDCALRAIIAIHNTRLGPALGGCRCLPYPGTEAALGDAMRLARGMSYKAAILGLPHGGGKAVLMRPERIADREAYFGAFGEFIETLGGRFITAVDSGTGVAEMDLIARRTRHVKSTSREHGGQGDPSPYTALGVCHGIEAAARFQLGRSDLEGLHVLIQGVGHVGLALAQELHRRGACLTVCDTDPRAVERCADTPGCAVVAPDHALDLSCDVFAPCTLGAVIDDHSATRLNASIVAGAANNPLADARHAQLLHGRGILYAPDFVINAGGLLQVVLGTSAQTLGRIRGIHDTLMEIFQRAALRREPAPGGGRGHGRAPAVRTPPWGPRMSTVARFEVRHTGYLDAQSRVVLPLPVFARDPAVLLELYRQMLRTRLFDRQAVSLQRTGRAGHLRLVPGPGGGLRGPGPCPAPRGCAAARLSRIRGPAPARGEDASAIALLGGRCARHGL